MILSKYIKKLRSKILGVGVALSLLVGFALPARVLASPYGSGGYGACAYGTGCSSSSSGGSSSTGGSTPSTTSSGQILLNDYQPYTTDTGQELILKEGQVIYFDVTTDGQVVRHKITIVKVGPNYVDIIIASNPIHDRLYTGDTKQYDVNNDGVKDIEVTLNGISTSGKADMTFKSLTPVTASPNPSPSTVTPAKKHYYLWLIVSIAAILLGLIIIIIAATKRRKRDGYFTPNQ